MRLVWRAHLGGPLYLGGTLWRSKRRRRGRVYHGRAGSWTCPHDHRREDTAIACAQREARRREMKLS
jgi:hypothetical protein